MSSRFIYAALFSAALLGSYSSAIAADIRPAVSKPLNEARVLANGSADKAAVMAKLNQAASVPNLNGDERDQIRSIGKYALARIGHAGMALGPPTNPFPSTSPNISGWTGLH